MHDKSTVTVLLLVKMSFRTILKFVLSFIYQRMSLFTTLFIHAENPRCEINQHNSRLTKLHPRIGILRTANLDLDVAWLHKAVYLSR
jgi:hypothetical protein